MLVSIRKAERLAGLLGKTTACRSIRPARRFLLRARIAVVAVFALRSFSDQIVLANRVLRLDRSIRPARRFYSE